MASKSEKTEKPTSRRRRKAREEGRVPRSKEISFALLFSSVFLLFNFLSPYFLHQACELFIACWEPFFFAEITFHKTQEIFSAAGWYLLLITGPLVGLMLVVSVGSNVMQGGFLLATEAMKMKPEKLNPAQNAKKIFSKQGLVQLVKTLILVSIMIYLSYSVIRDNLPLFQSMVVMDIRSILAASGDIFWQVGIRVAVFLCVVGVADYLFQRYQFEENLKMTKQEVKDDHKDTEGNPLIKRQIRKRQMEMAVKRMMAAVKEADVVVTNPTHYAVALKFDMATMGAPEVVAKGKGFVAKRIREIAEENDVPVVENVFLARTLYGSVEIGSEVPIDLYKAVAQVLAYVYKLKGRRIS